MPVKLSRPLAAPPPVVSEGLTRELKLKIDEILARDPEEILKLSEPEIETLLSPFFPTVRQAVMPPEKARKLGLDRRMIQSYIEATKGDLEKMVKK